MKSAENLRNRLDVLNQIQPYVGTYYSKQYVRKNVLQLSDEDIEIINQQNEEEPVEVMDTPQGQPSALQASELSKEVQQ